MDDEAKFNETKAAANNRLVRLYALLDQIPTMVAALEELKTQADALKPGLDIQPISEEEF